MKEFDLELAKAGHPVQTRDGRKARILCFDSTSEYGSILALVTIPNGREVSHFYYEDGRFYKGTSSRNDLFMASEKHEGWINLFRFKNSTLVAGCFDSEDEAKSRVYKIAEWCVGHKYIKTIKIEWEE